MNRSLEAVVFCIGAAVALVLAFMHAETVSRSAGTTKPTTLAAVPASHKPSFHPQPPPVPAVSSDKTFDQWFADVAIWQKQSTTASRRVTLSSQLLLYRLQHDDRLPDFGTYPEWDQLTRPTDRAGRVRTGGQDLLGPYLSEPLINALNGSQQFVWVNQPVSAGQRLSRPAGWVWSLVDQRLYATDATAAIIWDEQVMPIPQWQGPLTPEQREKLHRELPALESARAQ